MLVLLATREGTSITIIDNKRDALDIDGTWGQRLFVNQHGERCNLSGQSESDSLELGADTKSAQIGPHFAEGISLVMLVQVPLKMKEPMRLGGGTEDTGVVRYCMASDPESDIEHMVIDDGKVGGRFIEIDDLRIERDPDYPIRVTVQFYKSTNSGTIVGQDMVEIAAQIKSVYNQANYVGRLIV